MLQGDECQYPSRGIRIFPVMISVVGADDEGEDVDDGGVVRANDKALLVEAVAV